MDINNTILVDPNTSIDDGVVPLTLEENAFQTHTWELNFINLLQDPVEICFAFHTYSIVTCRPVSTIVIGMKSIASGEIHR